MRMGKGKLIRLSVDNPRLGRLRGNSMWQGHNLLKAELQFCHFLDSLDTLLIMNPEL